MSMASFDYDSKPLIFVTVGTDHHPFDRLVRWVDAWIEAGGGQRARCFVQTGTSAPPLMAEWKDFLHYATMVSVMREAAVVVCHGGPGTIMDCRDEGLVPIVVPRRSRLGEHVDDHQTAFAKRMAELGQIHLAEKDDQLWQLLERAVEEPEAFRMPQSLSTQKDTVRAFEELVGDLLRRPPRTTEAIAHVFRRGG